MLNRRDAIKRTIGGAIALYLAPFLPKALPEATMTPAMIAAITKPNPFILSSALTAEQYRERYIKPAIAKLCDDADRAAARVAYAEQ